MNHTVLLVGILLLASNLSFGESKAALERLRQVEQAKSRSWTFEIGYNEALEYSLDEITGLKIPENWQKGAQFTSPKMTRELSPALDWREKANGLTPIKNQKKCGSCWAFGTIGVLESAIKIRDNLTLDLSEQQLVSCHQSSYGCRGGWFAHDYHLDPGASLSEHVPYLAADTECKEGISPVTKIDDWGYVDTQSTYPTVEELKTAIAEYGPIAALVAVSDSFKAYKSGIYNADDSINTNHLVVLVGWNDDGKYWILRNSWGPTWGEEGYMRIGYEVNAVGKIASYVNYKSSCTPQPVAYTGQDKTINVGESVTLGDLAIDGQTYEWSPSDSLDDAKSSSPIATPKETTTYTLRTKTSCGSGKRQVTVKVIQP